MPPTSQRASGPLVSVVRAEARDEPLLARLLELYLHDFTEIVGGLPDDEGRFGYARLPLYWSDPQRHPYLFRANGRLAGFALLQRGSMVTGDPAPMDVAEFFVVRGARRSGVGTDAARAVFLQHPGPFEVRVLAANAPALPFWRGVTAAVAANGVDERPWRSTEGRAWHVLRFHVPRRREGAKG